MSGKGNTPSSTSGESSAASGTSKSGDYTITSRGTNDQGNRYDHRDYGAGADNQNSYHYSNKDGSYYYSNPDGSTYHNDGQGNSEYKR